MLFLRTMGCGRSKHRSRSNSTDDSEKETNKKKHKTGGNKNDKSNKIVDEKENQNPHSTIKPHIWVKKPEREAGTVPTTNGMMGSATTTASQGSGHTDVNLMVRQDRTDGKSGTKSAFRDKALGNNQNIRVTNSQVEFFKMLDEKIDQGTDYNTSEDELENGAGRIQKT